MHDSADREGISQQADATIMYRSCESMRSRHQSDLREVFIEPSTSRDHSLMIDRYNYRTVVDLPYFETGYCEH
jgi:hypothetical protein